MGIFSAAPLSKLVIFWRAHCPNGQFSGGATTKMGNFCDGFTAQCPNGRFLGDVTIKMGNFCDGSTAQNGSFLDTSTAQMSPFNYYQRSWSPNKAQYTILSKIKLVGNSHREIRSTKTAFSRFFFIISRISFWRFNWTSCTICFSPWEFITVGFTGPAPKIKLIR